MPEYLGKSKDVKDCINFFIVSSVKGGCGKSSIAFDLACKKEKSVIIDLDISGSTWSLFFDLSDQKYITDIHSQFDIDDRLIMTKKVKDNKEVSLIMNDSSQKSKQHIYDDFKRGNVPEIDHGIFKNNIIKIIEFLIDEGRENIIFDMPPCLDMYAGSIFDFLCKCNTKLNNQNSRKYKLNFILCAPPTVIGVKSIYDWIYTYFTRPNNMGYVADIKKINVEVYYVDLLKESSPTLNDDLKRVINKEMDSHDDFKPNKMEDIKNHIVGYSNTWNKIANKESKVEDFETFDITDIKL